MASFVAVLSCDRGRWRGEEVSLADCESVTDIADVALDADGPLRLVLIEEDDEYAAIVRVDDDEEPRAFLSDGHAAEAYPLAAVIADDLDEAYRGDPGDEDILEDAPPAHESAPVGDTDIVEDLGTPADDLLRLCAAEGMLPIDLLLAVCDKAGCGSAFDDLRA
jgi:putative tRNA adenosine deaminase-associated protein